MRVVSHRSVKRRAPLVDSALPDPLAIPSGVDVWLRRIEENARDLHSRLLEAMGTADPQLELAREIFAELDRLLNDPRRSSLHRILRRPLLQLSLDTPAARSFHRNTTSLFERAGEAIGLQHEADAFRAEVAEIRLRYQERFPRSLARHLRAARLESGDLVGVRRSTDIQAMRTRLGRIDSILGRLVEEARGWDPPEGLVGEESDAPTLQELRAMTCLRLRERAAVLAHPIALDPLRTLAARHVNALSEASSSPRAAFHPSHVAAVIAAEASLPRPSGSPREGEDTLLWPGLLAAAGAARAEGARSDAGSRSWSPRLQHDPLEGPPAESVTTHFVRPIDDDYALISPQHRSGVSVSSRRIGIGEKVECTLYNLPGDEYDVALAVHDLSPLFDGVSPTQPARYGTRRRAELRIVARFEDEWYARILRRGEVSADSAGAADRKPEPRTLRVLHRPSSAAASGGLLDVQPVREDARDLVGIRTRPVHAPVTGTGLLWLRLPARNVPLLHRRLESERELWTRLRATSSNLVPQLIGRGRLAGGREEGYLYVPPAALRAGDTSPLERWMREEPAPFARAMARIFVAVNQTGFALGLYHFDAFAFAIGDGKLRTLRPRAVLVCGAVAARHGDSFVGVQGVADLAYPRIRFRGLPPLMMSGGRAAPESDAVGFGLLLLELFAARPLGPGGSWFTWDELVSTVEQKIDHFVLPKLALRLAHALAGESSASPLPSLIEQLAREA